jgi:ATP adenylyltransferase
VGRIDRYTPGTTLRRESGQTRRDIEAVSYEQIWAPWRLSYVKGEKPDLQTDPGELEFLPGADPECFLCQAVADPADRRRHVVHRGGATITVLNRYPYNNGHLLIAPLAHKARLDELTPSEHAELAEVATRMVGLLESLIQAEGFNVGLNLGRAAGAGLPGHLHWHVVPRWSGDTNFMPPLAAVKVIPQSLDALWEALTEALAGGGSPGTPEAPGQ